MNYRVIYIAYIFCAILVLEPLLAAYYFVKTGELFYFRTREGKGDMPVSYHVANAVFQPYFGYTLRPGRVEAFEEAQEWRDNKFGFV